MNPADKMRRLFDDAAVQTNAAPDHAVFETIRTAYTRTVERKSAQQEPRMWRSLMKSPSAQLAVAAVVLIACVIGLSLWRATGSGIALADVLTQVEQITAYRFQVAMTVSGKTPTGIDVNWNTKSTILIAQAGMKITTDMAGPNDGQAQPTEAYLLPQEKAMIVLRPGDKQYARTDLDDTLLEDTRQENYDPSSMLKGILDCKYESLGRSVIDGVDVEGFQTTDPNYMGETPGRVDVKIWVDVKTRLPVRSETDVQIEDMQVGDMQIHGVVHDFQWNYPVDANTFKPVILADYTDLGSEAQPPAIGEGDAISSSKLLPSNEEGAIAGLKLCADLTGRYPERLDFRTFASLMIDIGSKNNPSVRQTVEQRDRVFPNDGDDKLSPEEMERRIQEALNQKYEHFKKIVEEESRKTMDEFMPVQRAVVFYATLIGRNKDPAYYGNVVMPQDKDKVLMRWKISDDRYRVIFGGLHAETVDAPTLAELEKTLPK
jgi:hypothetical protein